MGCCTEVPVIDMKIEIMDGSYHEVDSNELAFKMAAIFAVKDAMQKAGPILLEPIMSVECSTPDEYQGDILGDINRRRGKIMNVDSKNLTSVVKAEVPLAEMFGYVNTIRSLSRGRAAYSMEPSHFRAGSVERSRSSHPTKERLIYGHDTHPHSSQIIRFPSLG